jgi:hypothetical protein
MNGPPAHPQKARMDGAPKMICEWATRPPVVVEVGESPGSTEGEEVIASFGLIALHTGGHRLM